MTAAGQGRIRAESAEVLYAVGGLVTVDAATIDALIHDAERNRRRRIRLCAHLSVDEAVHEMLIVHDRSCYVRPHKHVGKSESFHVIDGSVDVVIFDELGAVRAVVSMGSYQSGKPFFYRVAEPWYHTLIIRSDVLVFHETTSGPFRPDQTVLAPWSPDGSDDVEVATYLSGLNAALARMLDDGQRE